MLDQYSATDPSSTSNKFLDSVNSELEQTFTSAACIAKEMNDTEDSQLAAKRVFSYNPDSKKILELFPQYEPIISEINELVNKYIKALSIDQENADSWRLLGNCYLIIGDFPNALASYSRATRIDQDSQNVNFLYAMGIVYAHFKHNEYALKYFQSVLDINPNFIFADDIKFRIALLQRTLQGYDNALRMFEKIKHSPPNGLVQEDILMQIAFTYQLSGNPENAHQIYTDLHQRFPDALKLTQQYCHLYYRCYNI